MNRLWVRLSIFYTSIMLMVAGLIVLLAWFSPAEHPTAAQLAETDLLQEQIDAMLLLYDAGLVEQFLVRLFSAQLLLFSTVAIVGGILGSIFISYRLTRPLTELDEAARKLGERDLKYRVVPRGSAEMVTLAESFNGMAAALESAENRRQNLLADVSHELRTPLTVMQGNLRAALDDVVQLDSAEIGKLYDQSRQLNHLINDLHDLAQAEANRLPLVLNQVDLGELVQQAGEIFAPMAETDGIAVAVEAPTETPLIHADRARLMQVLQNLIANGLRYAKSEVRLSVRPARDAIMLTVADDGVGIAGEHLAHIFDRFYRVDESRTRATGGTGLGLAIVKSIVEAHGGGISAESTPNSGTRMIISLPINAAH